MANIPIKYNVMWIPHEVHVDIGTKCTRISNQNLHEIPPCEQDLRQKSLLFHVNVTPYAMQTSSLPERRKPSLYCH